MKKNILCILILLILVIAKFNTTFAVSNNENYIEEIEEDDEEETENNGGFFGINPIKIIEDAITKWTINIVNSLSTFFMDLTDSVIFPENSISVFKNVFEKIYSLSTSIAMSLLILMTLFKGFNTYILWKDGNPEENPIEIIVRYLFAIAMILCFKEIYNIFGNIVEEILNKIQELMAVSTRSDESFFTNLFNSSLGWAFIIIFIIIYIVQLAKAMITTLSKGIELFILRLGFPLACVNAVSTQASTFHSYTSSFVKAFFSVIVMKLLVSLSVTIIFNNPNPFGLAWSIASLVMVNKGSGLINQFIVPVQGGSGIIGSAMNQTGSSMIRQGLGKVPGIGK